MGSEGENETWVAQGEAKFVEMILLLAKLLTEDVKGGATKLNKALWYSEVLAVRSFGHPITDTEYQRLPWGPAPRRLLPVRERLIAQGDLELVEDDGQARVIPHREPDLTVFERGEVEIIDHMATWLRDMPAWKVSELSHWEPAWFLARDGEMIIPEMAYLRPAVVLPEIKERARQIAARRADEDQSGGHQARGPALGFVSS